MEKLYLDNAATTAAANEVIDEIRCKLGIYGNPSSRHSIGKQAKIEIEAVREKIAKFIGAKSEEIIFTSGATESNNLVIKGILKNSKKKHVIVSAIEHPSIIEVCEDLKNDGIKVSYVGVGEDGILSPEDVQKAITKDTALISVMHVNNEIGTIQPIEEIGKMCKAKGVLFHTDAVQSFGKIKIDVNSMGVDLMSVSGHKLNALKGVGFLYARKGVKIHPLINGGGQEINLRSGTENFIGIVSLGRAIDLKRKFEDVKKSRDRIVDELLKIPGAKLNGSREKRIYNNIAISFYGIEGESLQMLLDEDGICVSTGSACGSNKLAGSHVLKAINVGKFYLNGNIRISLDSLNVLTRDQENYVINKIKENVQKLSNISPFKFSAQGVSSVERGKSKNGI